MLQGWGLEGSKSPQHVPFRKRTYSPVDSHPSQPFLQSQHTAQGLLLETEIIFSSFAFQGPEVKKHHPIPTPTPAKSPAGKLWHFEKVLHFEIRHIKSKYKAVRCESPPPAVSLFSYHRFGQPACLAQLQNKQLQSSALCCSKTTLGPAA